MPSMAPKRAFGIGNFSTFCTIKIQDSRLEEAKENHVVSDTHFPSDDKDINPFLIGE